MFRSLIYKKGISAYAVTNLRRNQSITGNTLEKRCGILDCTPNDIVRFVKNDRSIGLKRSSFYFGYIRGVLKCTYWLDSMDGQIVV
ncbi:MAG: helix-turn-helix domain-containing protein [Faecousia sp.]